MHRRTFIGCSALAMGGLAGCMEDGPASDNGPNTPESDTSEDGEESSESESQESDTSEDEEDQETDTSSEPESQEADTSSDNEESQESDTSSDEDEVESVESQEAEEDQETDSSGDDNESSENETSGDDNETSQDENTTDENESSQEDNTTDENETSQDENTTDDNETSGDQDPDRTYSAHLRNVRYTTHEDVVTLSAFLENEGSKREYHLGVVVTDSEGTEYFRSSNAVMIPDGAGRDYLITVQDERFEDRDVDEVIVTLYSGTDEVDTYQAYEHSPIRSSLVGMVRSIL